MRLTHLFVLSFALAGCGSRAGEGVSPDPANVSAGTWRLRRKLLLVTRAAGAVPGR
jgi:hypothetical protein